VVKGDFLGRNHAPTILYAQKKDSAGPENMIKRDKENRQANVIAALCIRREKGARTRFSLVRARSQTRGSVRHQDGDENKETIGF